MSSRASRPKAAPRARPRPSRSNSTSPAPIRRRAPTSSRSAPPATSPPRAAPTALGPNLWDVVGEEIGKGAGGFPFSDALRQQGRHLGLEQPQRVADQPEEVRARHQDDLRRPRQARGSRQRDRLSQPAERRAASRCRRPRPKARPRPLLRRLRDAAASTAPEGVPEAGKGKDVPVQTEAQAAAQPQGQCPRRSRPGDVGPRAAQEHP